MLAKVLLLFLILLNILMPYKYNCARLTFSDRILLSNFTKILTKNKFHQFIKLNRTLALRPPPTYIYVLQHRL